MPTPQLVMWKIMQQNMVPGRWYSNGEVYNLISKYIDLQEDDWDPATTNRSDPRWQRNVRNIFQYRKKTDELLWSGSGQYMLPITQDSIAQSASTSTGIKLSEDQFQLLQDRRKETGVAGELFVLRFEQDRLRGLGRSDLSDAVRRISTVNVGAGYDIESFNDDGSPRKIEVKATRTSRRVFEITRNELNMAQKLGPKYWIYFVSDLGGRDIVTQLQDPAALIGRSIQLEPIAYIAKIL